MRRRWRELEELVCGDFEGLVCGGDVGFLQADAQRVDRWQGAPTPPTNLGLLLYELVGRGHLPHIFLLRQRHRCDVEGLVDGALHRLDPRRGRDRTIDLEVSPGSGWGGVCRDSGDGGVSLRDLV